MRQTLNRTLVDSATVQRAVVDNVGGEQTEVWNDLATVACRITHARGGETGEQGGRIAEETSHLVTVAAGTDVEEADRLVIAGSTYEVLRVDKRGSWELSRRIQVKEAV